MKRQLGAIAALVGLGILAGAAWTTHAAPAPRAPQTVAVSLPLLSSPTPSAAPAPAPAAPAAVTTSQPTQPKSVPAAAPAAAPAASPSPAAPVVASPPADPAPVPTPTPAPTPTTWTWTASTTGPSTASTPQYTPIGTSITVHLDLSCNTSGGVNLDVGTQHQIVTGGTNNMTPITLSADYSFAVSGPFTVALSVGVVGAVCSWTATVVG